MTNEETIIDIRENIQPIVGGKSLDIAISALEKQIPKKPKILKVHAISNYKYGECECGESIMDDEKYCSNCGQALKWGDNE